MVMKTQVCSLTSASNIKRIASNVTLPKSNFFGNRNKLKSLSNKVNSKELQLRAVSSTTSDSIVKNVEASDALKGKKIVFVMGGPGSGKGTQCEMLCRGFDTAFFSAGDLIRQFLKSGSKKSHELQEIIMDGRVIPSQVTVGLLCDAMRSSEKKVLLVDGFPRNVENRSVFRSIVGRDCDVALFFKCPESEMHRRLLARREGRADDNEETIKKRVAGFSRDTLPVVQLYDTESRLLTVAADRPPQEVYSEVRQLFRAALFAN